MSEEKKDIKLDTSKMNIFQKIQTIRVELQQLNLKKTGENKFSKFQYFELGDFIGAINELCLKYGLFTYEDITTEFGRITAVNMDKPEETFTLTIPTAEVDVKSMPAIQAKGSLVTYARRYLYMLMFEIAESDTLDAIIGEDEKPSKKKTTKNNEKTSEEESGNTKLKKLCTELSSKGKQKEVQDILLEKAKVRNPNSITDEKLIAELMVELNKLEA